MSLGYSHVGQAYTQQIGDYRLCVESSYVEGKAIGENVTTSNGFYFTLRQGKIYAFSYKSVSRGGGTFILQDKDRRCVRLKFYVEDFYSVKGLEVRAS